jgi:uncharacterized membrane protein YkvI
MQTSNLTPEEAQGLSQFTEEVNEELRAAGAERAEQAFGLGCAVGLLPAITLAVVFYLLPMVNIVLAIIFLLLIMLILVAIVMLLSFRARRNAIDRTYENKINSEIEAYIREHNLTRLQFDTLASGLVSEGTPLRGYLSPQESTKDEK